MVKQVSAGCSAREGPAFQSSKQTILHLLGPGTEGAPGSEPLGSPLKVGEYIEYCLARRPEAINQAYPCTTVYKVCLDLRTPQTIVQKRSSHLFSYFT